MLLRTKYRYKRSPPRNMKTQELFICNRTVLNKILWLFCLWHAWKFLHRLIIMHTDLHSPHILTCKPLDKTWPYFNFFSSGPNYAHISHSLFPFCTRFGFTGFEPGPTQDPASKRIK